MESSIFKAGIIVFLFFLIPTISGNTACSDTLCITEETHYSITHNTVYITLQDLQDKDDYVDVLSEYPSSGLANQLEYSDFYWYVPVEVPTYELVEVELGKCDITYFSNSTPRSCYFGAELQDCDSISFKSDKYYCNQLQKQQTGTHYENKWQQVTNSTKAKLIEDGKIKYKQSNIKLPKSSTIQLKAIVYHPLFYNFATPHSENKYDISVAPKSHPCTAGSCVNGITVLDPTWWDGSWGKYINLTYSGNGTGLLNHQVCGFINMTNVSNNGAYMDSCAELRVVNSTHDGTYNFWWAPNTCNLTAEALYLCFNATYVSPTGGTAHLYFNNSAATFANDSGNKTFQHYYDKDQYLSTARHNKTSTTECKLEIDPTELDWLLFDCDPAGDPRYYFKDTYQERQVIEMLLQSTGNNSATAKTFISVTGTQDGLTNRYAIAVISALNNNIQVYEDSVGYNVLYNDLKDDYDYRLKLSIESESDGSGVTDYYVYNGTNGNTSLKDLQNQADLNSPSVYFDIILHGQGAGDPRAMRFKYIMVRKWPEQNFTAQYDTLKSSGTPTVHWVSNYNRTNTTSHYPTIAITTAEEAANCTLYINESSYLNTTTGFAFSWQVPLHSANHTMNVSCNATGGEYNTTNNWLNVSAPPVVSWVQQSWWDSYINGTFGNPNSARVNIYWDVTSVGSWNCYYRFNQSEEGFGGENTTNRVVYPETYSQGNYSNITFNCQDVKSGQNSTWAAPHWVYYDNQTPSITINSPANQTNTSSQLTWNFNFTADDDTIGNCTLYINSANDTMVSANDTPTNTVISKTFTSEGLKQWYIQCNDSAENSANSLTRNLRIDLNPSNMNMTWGYNTTYGGNTDNLTMRFNLSVVDNVTSVRACTIDINGTNNSMTNNDSNTTQWYYNNANMKDGYYNITFYCNDTYNHTTRNITGMRVSKQTSIYNFANQSLAADATSYTITFRTDMTATCRYAQTPGTGYGSMLAITTTNGKSHTLALTGLSLDTVNNYYFRCNNTNAILNDFDRHMTVTTVSGGGGTTPGGGGGTTIIETTGDDGSQLRADPDFLVKWYPHFYGQKAEYEIATTHQLVSCEFDQFDCEIKDFGFTLSWPKEGEIPPNDLFPYIYEKGRICKSEEVCESYEASLNVWNFNYNIGFPKGLSISIFVSPDGITVVTFIVIAIFIIGWIVTRPNVKLLEGKFR